MPNENEQPLTYAAAKKVFTGPEERPGDEAGWEEIVTMKLDDLRQENDGDEEKALKALSDWYMELVSTMPEVMARLRDESIKRDRALMEEIARQRREQDPELPRRSL